MSPQLSKQQWEHAISNLQRRVNAKKLECHALATFRDHSPAIFGALSMLMPADADAQDSRLLRAMTDSMSLLREATINLATAKLNTALVDLEELELNLRAYSQMSSGIVGATMIPGNSKQH